MLIFLCSLFMTNCTFRLVDYTVMSSKNVSLNIDKTQGKRTAGSKSYFLGIGYNLKDAMDDALENAGIEYDLLVDGVVTQTSFAFVVSVKVEGIAMNTKIFKDSMGALEYKNWLNDQNVFDPKNQEVVVSN